MTPRPVFRSFAPLVRPALLFGLAAALLGFRAATPRVAGGSTGRADMRVQIDPATGALVPAAAPAGTPGALSPESAEAHSTQGLTVELRADGTQRMDLQGRFMESAVATTDAAGGTALGCLPAGEAERFVGQSASPAAAPVPAGAVIRTTSAPGAPVER